MIRPLKIALFLAVGLIHPTAWGKSPDFAKFERCPLQNFPSPQVGRVSGCERAHCVAAEARFCKCLTSEGGEFRIESSGQATNRWPVAAYLGDTEDFVLLQGDLDGDGVKEWIVANRDSTGNGLAVRTWTLFILANLSAVPLQLRVEDFGAGSFLKAPSEKSCEILQTSWISGTESGLYFVGRWFRYAKGTLLTNPNLPELKRRLTRSFEKQRLDAEAKSPPHQLTPWALLRNSKAAGL